MENGRTYTVTIAVNGGPPGTVTETVKVEGFDSSMTADQVSRYLKRVVEDEMRYRASE